MEFSMPRLPAFFRTVPGTLLAGTVIFSAGAATGATLAHAFEPVAAMAPAPLVRIASLGTQAKPWSGAPIVTVRGRVAETYGSRFVVDDGSGHALVDAGREAATVPLAINQVATVQGRFEDGMIRAAFLVGPDGRVTALGHHGHGRDHHGGPPRYPDRPQTLSPPAPDPQSPAQSGKLAG
jgi:hypothetical protein